MKIKTVEGTVDELRHFELTEDYIHANLTDKTLVLDAMAQLRNSAFPNIFNNLQVWSGKLKIQCKNFKHR